MLKSKILKIINELKKDNIDIELLPPLILKKDFENNYENQEKITLYRNIGEIELEKLLNGQTINGHYNLSRQRKTVICKL